MKLNSDQLKSLLQKLGRGQIELDFFGILSKGPDCIYFVKANDKFAIEYEALSEEQKPYLEKLKDFAQNLEIDFIITTYHNKPNYKSDFDAPVLRLKTNSTIEQTIEIMETIQATVFGNGNDTLYDVVP